MTRSPGAIWSVGADAPTDIAQIRRRLRNTRDEAERHRLEEELQQLERGVLNGELERLSQRFGARFAPSETLRDMAARNAKFYP